MFLSEKKDPSQNFLVLYVIFSGDFIKRGQSTYQLPEIKIIFFFPTASCTSDLGAMLVFVRSLSN